MALEMNDLMMLKGLESKDSLTPYEQYKVGHMQSKRASGTAIAGLTVGVGAAVLAVGAAAWAGSRAQNAKDVAIAKSDGLKDLLVATKEDTNATLNRIITSLDRETDARRQGDLSITTTINDTVSGQQSGQLSQSQQLTNDIAIGLMTGKYSENPQKVELYSPAKAFKCGCGCND